MYANFFGLKQEPFSIAPDPRYLFMSERHREALAHLLYGLRGGGGFVLLTGEIGAGKTTVCRAFLGQIPKRCNVAYIFNPKLTVAELLGTVCEEYGIQQPAPAADSVKPFVDAINEFLLRTHAVGQNNVLIIDEAQNLSAEVLEQLRLLTNLETNERKLLQIILIGQPELRELLAAPELEQLSQRVIARFHLPALSEAETGHYVRHRLSVAGYSAAMPFEPKALRRIYQLSRGVPRRINLLCDRALLGAYSQDQRSVDRATVDRAAAEVFDQKDLSPAWRPAWLPRRAWAFGAAGLLAGAAVLAWTGREFLLPSTQVVDQRKAALTQARPTVPVPVAAPAIAKPLPPAQTDATTTLPASLGLRDEAQAWQELARSWRLELPETVTEPCQALAQQQMQCFRSSPGNAAGVSEGGLSLLRLLDRPAILSLRDDVGKTFYVILIKLDERYATVGLGEQTQRISLTQLSTQWRGEFATLWRAPPGYPAKGNSGPLLAWVDAQLATVYGSPPGAGPFRLDAALRGRLAAFQRSQGLRSDGQLGPITLMHLSRVAGADGLAGTPEPRLQAGKGAPGAAAPAP